MINTYSEIQSINRVLTDTVLSHIWYLKDQIRGYLLFFFTKIYKCVILVYKYTKKMTPEAERFNGWAAMLGFVAAVGAYVTTGQIIPGWF